MKKESLTDKELSDLLWKVIWRVRYSLEDQTEILQQQITRLEKKIDKLNSMLAKLCLEKRRK